MEAIKKDINILKLIDIKYVKYILQNLKSINYFNLNKNYNFIITKNVNDFIKYLNNNKYNCWGIKYIKQNFKLYKLLVLVYGVNIKLFAKYLNYRKSKLCLQVLKVYVKKNYKYINKQYISNLLL